MSKKPGFVALGDVYKELDFLSGQISTQTRTLALGLLALSWGLLVGETAVKLELDRPLRLGLIRVAMLTVVALLLDFLQYVVGLLYVDGARQDAERRGKAEVTYDYDALLYRARDWFFWLKVLTLVAASGYLLAILIPHVL